MQRNLLIRIRFVPIFDNSADCSGNRTKKGRGDAAALLPFDTVEQERANGTRSPCRPYRPCHPCRASAAGCPWAPASRRPSRSEEHTSELQSLMRISYAVFCLKKQNKQNHETYKITTYNSKSIL